MADQAIYGLRAMIWGLVIAMLMQTMPLRAQEKRHIRFAVLGVLTVNMVVALWQAVFGLSAVELRDLVESGASYQVDSQTRLLGLQATGQELSMLAGSAFVWACATTITKGFRAAGPAVWILGFTSAVVTLVVLQRSALIGALVALALLAFSVSSWRFSGRRGRVARRFIIVAGISMLSVVALAAYAPDRVDLALARFQTLFGLSSDYSFNVRQDTTLPVALRLIGEGPLGYGLGASGPVAAKFLPHGPLADYPLGGIAADNGYLFVGLQIGLPGLAAFILLLLTWAIYGSFLLVPDQRRSSSRAVICFLAAIMLSGSFWGLTGAMAVIAMLASLDHGDTEDSVPDVDEMLRTRRDHRRSF
ncbi:O-antigen ligase family protein [Pseudarthrobacter defluvii]|uniref:O-antigen ligase family protein n=1 Tax=Pseudarthrobacter defluvii TaxID=410837 RepID=UPI0027D7A6B3|nr:O-antigen ligase family protein [Pseudarthrobacter defluvii]